MPASHRVVAGPDSFSDNSEHSIVLDDAVAAGETIVLFVGCSVSNLDGIVGYADADQGLDFNIDEEYGTTAGQGFNGVSCLSAYCPDGLPIGSTIRFGVKWTGSDWYHGQSPFAVVVALNSGDGRYMVYDVSDSYAEAAASTTPATPPITTAADAIALGFFAGDGTSAAGWFTPGSGWTELADSPEGTESLFNIALEARIATTSYSGTASGTAPNAKWAGIIVSYKAVSAEPSRGPTILAGKKEPGSTSDFFAGGNTAAWPFVPPASGDVSALGARLHVDNPSIANMKLGVYAHDAANNRPGARLGQTAVITPAPKNLVPFKAAPTTTISLVSGTTYWLAMSATGEQIDLTGESAAGIGREGTGAMVTPWVAAGSMGATPGIWAEGNPPATLQAFRPDADLAAGGWTPSAGATLWEAVDEESPDGVYISGTAS